ncbi:heavy metal translocating P-type ATPase [Chitinimonas koreensis]|uniref:heavy metal translocating P-type ATPase n=1 Tax=Chitinimonas koreensis TaxID=356302 RepID=UPI000426A68F|nr:heavy metal translocating P-type ATPase [Chitinimonas koreensis]QNM98702.1 heavy metal translocating P-type ATPase [Chitinimonas koreensis]
MSSCCPQEPDLNQTQNRARPGYFPVKVAVAHGHHHHGGRGGCCATAAPAAPSAPLAVPAGSARSRLRIAEMDCPTEEALIRKKLGGLAEVHGLEFDLMQRVLTLAHAPGALPMVVEAIRGLGMKAEPAEADAAAPAAEARPTHWPLAAAGALALGAEAAHWAQWPDWLGAALALAALALCGIGTYRKGWIALRHGELNINALMSIAVTGAALIGQWPEAAMVMVLFTVAELIEARSLDRARNAIRGLMQLAPERATVRQADGRWAAVDARSVAVGAMVRIGPGERIGLDGVLVAGGSAVDQAPITGESIPVDKTVGDPVFAGSINVAGSFEYRVTAAAGDSTLARIIHAIEAAQGKRAPTQRFVDRFARIYTPTVFAIALAVALLPPLLAGGGWYDWIYKALVLLVIACPCALVISTPVTIVSGLAAAARHGILVKGGVYLEEGRKLAWLALDKTGTLTRGKPELARTVVLDGSDDAMQLAASLAARSDHPVSQAIARAGRRDAVAALEVDEFAALPGQGVRGRIGGRAFLLGNHRLIEALGVCTPELETQLFALEEDGHSVVLLSDGERVKALFAVADAVKDSSREAVARLHALGIRTAMLTGDNRHTAAAVARQVGIDEARGEQLPADKLAAIEEYARRGPVGMVGDGINDAPALARADIGFAMGAAGTDSAIETADVALMDDDLRKIARFVELSRSTHAILVQNIALALGIKAVFLALTLLGLGSMWMAVFADMGAALLVVGNGLRLLRR